MESPLISVIVPIYKVEKYLDRCVESIVNQTYKNLEIILVDDGSPDNCPLMCDSWKEKDNRIKVVHKENGGLSDARNAGISVATGEYVAFIDSDDWIYEKYLEILLDGIYKYNCNVAVCDFTLTSGDTPSLDNASLTYQVWKTEDFFCERVVQAVSAWAKIIKKADLKSIRFPKGIIHEDEFVTHKILFKYDKVVYIDLGMYFYQQREDSITKSQWTPDKLITIEATKQKLDFFSQNGYKKAELYCETLLFHNIQRNINGVIESGNNDYAKQYLKKLYRQRKAIFKKCLRHKSFSFKKNKWEFEMVYPRIMKIYWIVNSKFSFVRKVGKK